MNDDAKTLSRIRMALDKAVGRYLSDPNINLIDFGYPECDGQLVESERAICFHVSQKLSGLRLETAVASGQTQEIPPSIDGFSTDVREGRFRLSLQQWPWWNWRLPQSDPRAARQEVLRGGISISDEYHNSYGTLGGLVRDRISGVEMILSNWHVLVADWNARAGQRIYQPGRLDGGTGADAVATLTRDAMPVNLDAAVAALNRSRRLINDQYDLGSVRGVTQPTVGMLVVKSGRRTSVTYGRVEAIEGAAQINYGPVDRVIRKVVRILPRAGFQDQVSEPGDSGSFWLNTGTRQAVGLHFAGANFPETALAMDMQTVINALNVDLVFVA
jgi:endonuclease G, mitochondrial